MTSAIVFVIAYMSQCEFKVCKPSLEKLCCTWLLPRKAQGYETRNIRNHNDVTERNKIAHERRFVMSYVQD